MILLSILLIPVLGLLTVSVYSGVPVTYSPQNYIRQIKFIGLLTSILNLLISLIIFIKFDFSYNQFQFVQKYHNLNYYDFYLGIDGLSVYFILLTCIIMPISLLSNWTSISKNVKSYVIILLLLEMFLLLVFLVLDVLLYYVFFESILFPLFILIGLYGSNNKIRASFYLFLYTLIGSLFLLLSIINMYTITGVTDFDSLFKINFDYYFQFFIFYGIFLSFAVKTPTIFLNNWLLKAHVESPLGGSLILASVVLKLSLYGIVRLILPILPKAYLDNSYIIYVIGVISIIYASIATLRTIDVKELIAYSSVSHAAVYFLGVFSNNIQGIDGAIVFGLAHGFVSSGLFICTGGILYDRSGNRLITIYRGLTQIMPIFSILFFILCLANAGAPLTFNFIGEFMCLFGAFEKLPFLGIFASTSVVFSAAYSMYMLNRIIFAGSISKLFLVYISDINKREFLMVVILIFLTIFLGIYPAVVIDGLNYYNTNLIYSNDNPVYSLLFLSLFTLKRLKKYSTTRFIVTSAIKATVIGILFRYFYQMCDISPYISPYYFICLAFLQDIFYYLFLLFEYTIYIISHYNMSTMGGGDGFKLNNTTTGYWVKQPGISSLYMNMDNNNPNSGPSNNSGNQHISNPQLHSNDAQKHCDAKLVQYWSNNAIVNLPPRPDSGSNKYIRDRLMARSGDMKDFNIWYLKKYSHPEGPFFWGDPNQGVTKDTLKYLPVIINDFTDQIERGYIPNGNNSEGLHNIRCGLEYLARRLNTEGSNKFRLKAQYFTIHCEKFMLEHLKHTDPITYTNITKQESKGFTVANTKSFRESFPYSPQFSEWLTASSKDVFETVKRDTFPNKDWVKERVRQRFEQVKLHSGKSDTERGEILGRYDNRVYEHITNRQQVVYDRYNIHNGNTDSVHYEDQYDRQWLHRELGRHITDLKNRYRYGIKAPNPPK